jgi:hypothetical protein
MRSVFILISVFLGNAVFGQDPIIAAIIDSVRIERLIANVEEMSGEVPVDLGNGPITITSRHKDNPGNNLSQTYFEQRFVEMGYTPEAQPFNATGRNILVTKTGMVHPDEIVILCAHYDALPGGLFAAPAADDDGSGCAAVLEAARILRDIPFEYTIVFALWDEEEQGKIGSIYYAQNMAADDAVIKGVVNMDAIAYDGNGDTKARVHTRSVANSQAIADTVFAVLDRYNINIDLLLTDPGATYSDHASFWSSGYGAVLMIEEFGADGNPQYHTPNDRVQYFDVPYYEKLAKLSIGSFATLAVPFDVETAVDAPIATGSIAFYAYPNPTTTDATAWLELPDAAQYDVLLLNALGQQVATLHSGVLAAGKHNFIIPMQQLPSGTYTVVARSAVADLMTVRLVRTPQLY